MKKLYSFVILFSFLLMTAQAAFFNRSALFMTPESLIDSIKKAQTRTTSKITDTRPGKPSEIKSDVRIKITPFKPSFKPNTANSAATTTSSVIKSTSTTSPDVKILSNVKVYPNPVADHLNLSYNVNKDSNVTIKIMDVLGNELTTLLSQRLPAGEQTNSFPIDARWNSGYYFLRVVVGNETIIKRISIL